MIGIPPTGDFNVAWHVILVVFTPQGITDGAINSRLLTLQELDTLVNSGDALKIPTTITFNCQMVPLTVYLQGVLRNF